MFSSDFSKALIALFLAMTVFSMTNLNLQNSELTEKTESNTEGANQGELQGWAFLNISGPILPTYPVNATWYAEVTLEESYGTDLLGNRSLGLLGQIDENLGNSDGWVDSEESNEFAEMVYTARNWTNGESAGCCIFDYFPMIAMDGTEITVFPPIEGPVNRTGGNWGWIESAVLSGSADGRIMRLLDLPRMGALIEEIPLEVSLPEGWEFKFSPMMEIIEGTPDRFTVNRSEAPVAHDIRITIGENQQPTISATRFPSTANSIALNKVSSFSAVCSDSPLESPEIGWEVSRNGEILSTFQNPWFDFTPSEIGILHGDEISVTGTCTDHHGVASNWIDVVTVDGEYPEWDAEITLVNGAESTPHDILVGLIEIPAGGSIIMDVNCSDDSGLPVALDLFTNISNDWRQQGVDQSNFHFTVYQGAGVNGADISIEDRHLPKDPTLTSMVLRVTDDAGNEVIHEWIIRVLDSNPPVVMMDLSSNGVQADSDDGLHEDDSIQANLSRSFDDIDAIEEVIWSAWLDGNPLKSLVSWSEIENFMLPSMAQGTHELVIEATDSSGNSRNETFSLTVQPKRGAHISILSKSLSDDAVVGSQAELTLIVENQGTDQAFVRACLDGVCSRYEEIQGSTLESGPIQASVEFEFQINNRTITGLSLQWDSSAAGSSGSIPFEIEIDHGRESGLSSSAILTILLLASIGIVAAYQKMRNFEEK